MTHSACGYAGRDEALMAFLYDDGTRDDENRAARTRFEAHLTGCPVCRDELEALRGVRATLSSWAPPEPNLPALFAASGNQRFSTRDPHRRAVRWSAAIPAWAQVAAALLFLGVSAAVANLEIRYDASGLSIRTGWSRPPAAAPAQQRAPDAATQSELAALGNQLRAEFRSARGQAIAQPQPSHLADADVLRRVKALVDDSEKRQQRELALRVAEVLRDVNAQRQADLVKFDRAIGSVENRLGVQVMRNQQQMNYFIRTSQSR